MEELTVVLLSILGFCIVFYVLVHHFKPYSKFKQLEHAGRVLIVTSHPDDETMFFGPTILHLCQDGSRSGSATTNQIVKKRTHHSTSSNKDTFLLCLSIGDFKNSGTERRKELYKACEILGIPEENITVLSYTRLRDDPNLRWKEEIVSEIVLQTVCSYEINTIITFDRHGVSGHKNHCSIYSAMCYLAMDKKLPANCRVYTLKTVNTIRKYSSILDVPMSFLVASTVYTASLKDWCLLNRAMMAHRSQYVWFRKLYMIFSRYLFINTLDEMKLERSAKANSTSPFEQLDRMTSSPQNSSSSSGGNATMTHHRGRIDT